MKSVSIVIPVYNEERRLPGCIPKLVGFLEQQGDYLWDVVIADNGSVDRTLEIAQSYANERYEIRVRHTPLKGRGRAVKAAWLESEAEILCYMDVDLSTDLEALPGLVDSIANGECDLAVGSRLIPGSHTVRGWQRELISRAYALLVRLVCKVPIRDAQCGFKAISRRAAQELLPRVVDDGWFFDTELLVLACREGFLVKEMPVCWTENRDSRVRVMATAWEDLKGLWRMRGRWGR